MHEGKAGQQTGTAPYRVHIHRLVEGQWYDVQDLVVVDILPQMVALSEAYFQVYELKTAATPATQQQQQQAQSQHGLQQQGATPMEQ